MNIANLDNTSAATTKWFAVVDAAKRDLKYKQQYSHNQQTRAITIKDLLDCAFYHSGIYINYRKKFIAIKISSPQVKNPAVRNAVFDLVQANHYKMVSTAQGMIIRINASIV